MSGPSYHPSTAKTDESSTILDQRRGEHPVLRHVANDDGNLEETGTLRGAPAAFAGDDLPDAVHARLGADQDRLQHALVADRRGQLVQILTVEDLAGLIRIGLQALDRHALHARRQGGAGCDRLEVATRLFKQNGFAGTSMQIVSNDRGCASLRSVPSSTTS